jgi:hypothetical protein
MGLSFECDGHGFLIKAVPGIRVLFRLYTSQKSDMITRVGLGYAVVDFLTQWKACSLTLHCWPELP